MKKKLKVIVKSKLYKTSRKTFILFFDETGNMDIRKSYGIHNHLTAEGFIYKSDLEFSYLRVLCNLYMTMIKEALEQNKRQLTIKEGVL